jgi:hypothetical protein
MGNKIYNLEITFPEYLNYIYLLETAFPEYLKYISSPRNGKVLQHVECGRNCFIIVQEICKWFIEHTIC